MARHIHVGSVALLALIATACGSSGTSPHVSRLATFNAGLARNYVPLAEDRVTPVTQALAALDADVLCLQEVWEEGDTAQIHAGTKATYPHAFDVFTQENASTTPACTAAETDPLKACVDAQCKGVVDLATCALSKCNAEVIAVSKGCLLCLQSNIAKGVDGLMKACAEGSSSFFEGGRNGVRLLSRVPLTATDHLVLESYFIRYVALYARVELATGPLHVFCTHLQADMNLPYLGAKGSFVAEQVFEIEQLLAWIETKAGKEPTALLGDLNCGPARPPDLDGEVPQSYARFPAAGFKVPHVDRKGECTWCKSNTLHGGAGPNNIIDHVMLRHADALAASATTRRLFAEPVTIPLASGVTETSLSDHFGLLVELTAN